MAGKVLFITTNYLAENSVINKNVDVKVIKPFIILAQEKRIEPLLGTALMNRLESDISGNTLSGNYKILVDDYIQRTLVEWTIVESMPFLNFKFTNKAISKKSGDNSESSELNEIRFLRDTIKDSAQYYSQRLINYLKSDTTIFPEYLNPGTSFDTITPASTNYFQGLYLP